MLTVAETRFFEANRRSLKGVRFLVLSLLVTSLLSATVQGFAAVDIVSDSGYLDSIGFYHVVGEAKNSGNLDVYLVQITASFYDSSSSFISNSTSPTSVNIVLAGRKAPFDIVLDDAAQSVRVDHYRLNLAFSTYRGDFPLGLEITSDRSDVVVGWMHVTGAILNNASATASSVKVVATFYNATGGVVATAFTAPDTTSIGPGVQANFDIVLVPDRVPLVATYALTADSLGYGLISKLPFNSVLLLEAPKTSVGKQTTLTATLRDENRNPIPAAEIEFSINDHGAWKIITSSTTDEKGKATGGYTPAEVGRFTIRALYVGGMAHSSSNDFAVLLVESNETSPRPTPIPSPAALPFLLSSLIFTIPLAVICGALVFLLFKKVQGYRRRQSQVMKRSVERMTSWPHSRNVRSTIDRTAGTRTDWTRICSRVARVRGVRRIANYGAKSRF